MRSVVLLGLILVTLMPAFGCGEAQSEAAQQSIAATERMVAAATKTAQAESYRQKTVGSCCGNSSNMSVFETEVASSDTYRLRLLDGSEWTEVICIEGNSYQASSEEAEWKPCEMCSLVHIAITGAVNPLKSIVDVEVYSDALIDDDNCSHYGGKIDTKAWTETWGPEASVDYVESVLRWHMEAEVWIDEDDYIRQLETRVEAPYIDQASGEEKWQTRHTVITFSDFGQTISIEPPEEAIPGSS